MPDKPVLPPDYVYVHQQVKNKLLDNLKKYILRFYGANPKESKDYGRIVNEKHTERLKQLIDRDNSCCRGRIRISKTAISRHCFRPRRLG